MKKAYQGLIRYLFKARKRLDQIYIWPTIHPFWHISYLSLSSVFNIWQRWNFFCREVVILSCQGTRTRSGSFIPSRSMDNSWKRISYEAKEYGRRRTPSVNRRINLHRYEPTWGDVDFLLRALPGINPNNLTNLNRGFGVSLNGPRHLQIVRNSCAHLDSESIADIKKISSFYIGKNLTHPIDLIWWLDPSNRADAIFSWIDELESIADLVTK